MKIYSRPIDWVQKYRMWRFKKLPEQLSVQVGTGRGMAGKRSGREIVRVCVGRLSLASRKCRLGT